MFVKTFIREAVLSGIQALLIKIYTLIQSGERASLGHFQ